jgi:Na+/proline symporter
VNILGIAIFAYFHTHADKMDPGAPNDQIVPMFAVQGLSPGFSGIIIAAIFASAMSTVASSMNSSATIFTQDFFMRRFPATGDKTKLRVLRLTSLIVGVTGTGMALVLVSKDIRSMMVVWNQIVALLGGGIVGLYSLGMLTKRATVVGAIGGVCCSIMITSYVWAFTRLHWASYTPIAILSCIACGYVLSLVLPGRQRDLRGLTIFTLNSSQGAASCKIDLP